MIKNIAAAANEERAKALQRDIRVVVPLHEAGHVLMANLLGRDLPVLMPALVPGPFGLRIAEHAGGAIELVGLDKTGIIDFCFGGYCAELALYDESYLRRSVAPFFVNGDRAANDCISLVGKIGLPNAHALMSELSAGGERASSTVRTLFQQHGIVTYRKMRSRRAQLINLAQELFDFWQANNFARCTWCGPRS